LLREFELGVRSLPSVLVTDEQLSNALGVDAQHDALCYGRAVCQAAMSHSLSQHHELLTRLASRVEHVVARMLLHAAATADEGISAAAGAGALRATARRSRMISETIGGFLRRPVEEAFSSLLRESLRECMQACYTDIRSVVAPRGGASEVSTLWPIFASPANDVTEDGEVASWAVGGWVGSGESAVDALVTRLVGAWRRQFALAVKRKVRYFLISLAERLPTHLLRSLHTMCDEPTSTSSLDVASARAALLEHKAGLETEHARATQLLDRFYSLRGQLEEGSRADRPAEALAAGRG